MPEKRTIKKTKQGKREGKSASTQAGEFVHEEIDRTRKGKRGARSAKQAMQLVYLRQGVPEWILNHQER